VFESTGVCPYGDPISPLDLSVLFYDETIVNVKITDPQHSRWEVPDIVQALPNPKMDNPSYTVSYSSPDQPFELNITRVTADETESKSQVHTIGTNNLFFSDQYIQFQFPLLNTSNVYGLGERSGPLRYNHSAQASEDESSHNTFSLFASDQGGVYDKLPLYGSHPFFMDVRGGWKDNNTGKTSPS